MRQRRCLELELELELESKFEKLKLKSHTDRASPTEAQGTSQCGSAGNDVPAHLE
jgi:hypothetical protein